jgi:hypothetical protein
MASSAARAAGLAGRDQPRRGALRVRRHRFGARLQPPDDGVDFAARFTQALVDLLIEPLAQHLFAILQVLFARPQLGRRVGQDLPFAGGKPPVVLQRLHVALDPGEVIGEQRFLLAAVRAGPVDDGRRQTQTVGDFECQAASGRSVVEPVRGREGPGIEAESGRGHALGRRRVGLEYVVVRRGDDHRPAQPEVLDDRHGERPAFDGVGAGAGLVEQHQGRRLERGVHGDDVGDVAGEGAQALDNRLLVPDVGEHRLEHRDL